MLYIAGVKQGIWKGILTLEVVERIGVITKADRTEYGDGSNFQQNMTGYGYDPEESSKTCVDLTVMPQQESESRCVQLPSFQKLPDLHNSEGSMAERKSDMSLENT